MTTGQKEIDIAFIVALDEEFRALHEFAGDWISRYNEAYGSEDYIFEIARENDRKPVVCVACFIDDMGPGRAADATHRVIDIWAPKVIVNVGIAASLKPDDLRICDAAVVAVAKQYAEKGKVSETDSGVTFESSGEYFNADPILVSSVRQFEFSNNGEYLEWRSSCANRLIENVSSEIRDDMIVNGALRAEPSLVKVSLASGPVVGAAGEFGQWILRADRNIKALEMEAAGVLRAVASRPTLSRVLVVRGISDFADRNKSSLDQESEGVFRSVAMKNCLDLVWRMVRVGRLDRVFQGEVEGVLSPSKKVAARGGRPSLELLKASVISQDVSVAETAMLALAYARSEGDWKFARWLDREIEGYEESAEDLPDYRRASVSSKMSGENAAKRVSNYVVPMQNLVANIRERGGVPEEFRRELVDMVDEQNTFQVLVGLAEVESYASQPPDSILRSPWPDQLMTFALPFVFNVTPTSAWQVVPPSVFQRVVNSVRKKIFDYVFPEGEFGEGG